MPNRTPAETDALHTIAAFILSEGARNTDWGDMNPEIGEDDWNAICDILNAKAPRVSPDSYKAAYALLEARAKASDG